MPFLHVIIAGKSGKPPRKQKVKLAQKPLSFGSGQKNSIRIVGKGAEESHCRIVPDGDGYVIENLSSVGTLVNKTKITRTRLRSGDEIQFTSGTKFVYVDAPQQDKAPDDAVHSVVSASVSGTAANGRPAPKSCAKPKPVTEATSKRPGSRAHARKPVAMVRKQVSADPRPQPGTSVTSNRAKGIKAEKPRNVESEPLVSGCDVPPVTPPTAFEPISRDKPARKAIDAAAQAIAEAKPKELPAPNTLAKPMVIRYEARDPGELERAAAKESVFDLKSVIVGLVIFLLLIFGAFLIRFTASGEFMKKLETFEFTSDTPEEEEIEITEPQREILEEQVQDEPEEMEEIEERPNIQITEVPTQVTEVQEVVKTEAIEVTTDIDVEVTEMDIVDAPEELAEVAEETTFAVTPIAAVSRRPADLFKMKEPNPVHKPQFALLNRAPQASRGLKMVPKQFGDLDAPTMGEIGPASINLFGNGAFMRSMGGGGGMEARTAVDAALRWLALHQEADGSWEPHRWDPEDIDFEKSKGGKAPTGRGNVEGITGFALLALMSGGHTIRKGEYRANVLRGLEWLRKKQDPKTGRLSGNMYAHGICTITLCEAAGRAPEEQTKLAARKAVDFCVQSVGADGGWRYQPRTKESDTSVTAWFIQALKTAKLARIKFDNRVFAQALTFLDRVTDRGGTAESNGTVAYIYKEGMRYGGGKKAAHSKGPAMTAAGMVIRQFTGMGVKAGLLTKGAEIIKRSPPTWEQRDFYYWYYATYAMHNMGGEYRVWWNRRIRDVLLQNQSKAGHQAGSWNPEGIKWQAGRVYTTSLGALCLEVYYRYGDALKSFGTAPDLEDLLFK